MQLMLAHQWQGQDPTGWWMSEKLDGVRAYWDGSQFWSRNEKPFDAPEFFTIGFPAIPLDGELWLDRGKFNEASGIVRRKGGDPQWGRLTYMVFDCINDTLSFEQRTANIPSAAKLVVLPQFQCLGETHLREFYAETLKLGGEGVMLRQPQSIYEHKRSHNLLKVKPALDMEGQVTQHLPGEGKHLGRLGTVHVILQNGKEVDVGTGFSDAERENPPPIGSIITLKYQELTPAGIPRFPVFLRVRKEE